jgi:sulfite exporter TauE/SafE
VDLALVISAALMGLAGTPHCLAMCGAACTAATGGRGGSTLAGFHLARMASYAVAGGVAAASVGTLASFGQSVAVLRPLWTLLHVAALGLGVWLLWHGRQPAWMENLGRARAPSPDAAGWQRIAGPGRSAAIGLTWAAWPCGLLQSALVIAALANHAATGALAMAAFAGASSVGLATGGVLWTRLAGRGGSAAGMQVGWMVRFAGLMLVAASAWALGHGLWMRIAAWCFG